MQRTVNTVIDKEKCIGCGQCVKVCQSGTIAMVDGKAAIVGDESLNCGHCQAVCPVDAVRVTSLAELEFATFTCNREYLKPGAGDPGKLVRLMAARRSCRNFKPETVSREMLQDLVTAGTTAPSGSNGQEWNFTVISGADEIKKLSAQIYAYYRNLNRIARMAFLRKTLCLLGNRALENYYVSYHDQIEEAIGQFGWGGKDLLFYEAAAVMVITCKKSAPCPADDALLAAQNIQLTAHSLGLGTCLIGFATEALRRSKNLRNFLKIPADENIYAVLSLGWPDETYRSIIPRRKVSARFIEL